MKKYKCVLCGEAFFGYGNNPWPLAKKGRCCNICNVTKVIPARVNLMFKGGDKK